MKWQVRQRLLIQEEHLSPDFSVKPSIPPLKPPSGRDIKSCIMLEPGEGEHPQTRGPEGRCRRTHASASDGPRDSCAMKCPPRTQPGGSGDGSGQVREKRVSDTNRQCGVTPCAFSGGVILSLLGQP